MTNSVRRYNYPLCLDYLSFRWWLRHSPKDCRTVRLAFAVSDYSRVNKLNMSCYDFVQNLSFYIYCHTFLLNCLNNSISTSELKNRMMDRSSPTQTIPTHDCTTWSLSTSSCVRSTLWVLCFIIFPSIFFDSSLWMLTELWASLALLCFAFAFADAKCRILKKSNGSKDRASREPITKVRRGKVQGVWMFDKGRKRFVSGGGRKKISEAN